jgi:hypothetical protein
MDAPKSYVIAPERRTQRSGWGRCEIEAPETMISSYGENLPIRRILASGRSKLQGFGFEKIGLEIACPWRVPLLLERDAR